MNIITSRYILVFCLLTALHSVAFAQEEKKTNLNDLQKKIVKAFKDKESSESDRLDTIAELIRKEKLQRQKDSAPVDLTQVANILRQTCYRCHKGEGSESGYAFNILNVASMIDDGILAEGDHESSEIFGAMFSGRMPPKNRSQLPRPTAENVDLIKNWIDQGAKQLPKPEPRKQLTLKNELETIRADLRKQSREDRFNIRYFTLTNLYNDSTLDLSHLKMTRIALAKALNSLSWESLLVEPKVVDQVSQTVFSVDISKLGWTRDHWNAIVKSYPYAVSYDGLDDSELGDIDADISDLRGGDATPVAIRADWMVSVATKPPLYYQLVFDLELPDLVARDVDPANIRNPKRMTDLDLEKYLGINVNRNIVNGKIWRAGFTQSGVSEQNRMVERHAIKSGGFYWKSYDFLNSNRTAILSEFPLGPKFRGNPFDELAFDHDGGEIIFSLPNGLQAYLLIDGKGSRIDAGPIEVVADSLKTSGNEQIVAGVSCIACHRTGMIEVPDDEVRKFSGVVGRARDQVRAIYPEDAEFEKLIAKDSDLFMRSLRSTVKPFLDDEQIDDMPEPVGEVARRYFLEPMTIETIAAELYISPEKLRGALGSDPRLRELGLRVLLREGGTIKRAAWEAPDAFPLMRQVARQFGYGPR